MGHRTAMGCSIVIAALIAGGCSGTNEGPMDGANS
jgi:hypothetical protein